MCKFFEIVLFPGFIKLGFKYFSYGISEIMRSLSKVLFVKSLKELKSINKEQRYKNRYEKLMNLGSFQEDNTL